MNFKTRLESAKKSFLFGILQLDILKYFSELDGQISGFYLKGFRFLPGIEMNRKIK